MTAWENSCDNDPDRGSVAGTRRPPRGRR
jgi:hypothetical protein